MTRSSWHSWRAPLAAAIALASGLATATMAVAREIIITIESRPRQIAPHGSPAFGIGNPTLFGVDDARHQPDTPRPYGKRRRTWNTLVPAGTWRSAFAGMMRIGNSLVPLRAQTLRRHTTEGGPPVYA